MFYPRISLGHQDKRLFALVYLVLKSITLRLVQFSQLGILQLNLSKADMLYKGHFFKELANHVQALRKTSI